MCNKVNLSLGLLLTLLLGSQIAFAWEWEVAVVDTEEYNIWGISLTLDRLNYPHISCSHLFINPWNRGINCMRYICKDQNGWHVTDIDSFETTDREIPTSIILDNTDFPHVAYYKGRLPSFALIYAYNDFSGWHFDTVEAGFESGMGTVSLRLDNNSYPHICYFGKDYAVKYAYRDTADSWQIESLGAGNSSVSLELDNYSYPHVAYVPKYAFKDTLGWHIEVLDTTSDVWGAIASLELDTNYSPHIAYHGFDWWLDGEGHLQYEGDPSLKYVYKDIFGWHFEVVDTGYIYGDTAIYWGSSLSLELDSKGYPHIAYNRGALWDIITCVKYAWKDSSGWHFDTTNIKDYGPIFWDISLELDSSDCPHIAYYCNDWTQSAPGVYYSIGSPSGVEENSDNSQNPKVYKVLQNQPNPFVRQTLIKYTIPEKMELSLKIYDITGRIVKDFYFGEKEPGYYTTKWDAKGFPTGVYFARFIAHRGGQAGDFEATKKLVLMR